MSVLIYTPIKWDSQEDWEMLSANIERLGIRIHAQNVLTQNDETKIASLNCGQFVTRFHSFEKVLEVTDIEERFRFVFNPNLIRIDGDKAALKRWLMMERLKNP